MTGGSFARTAFLWALAFASPVTMANSYTIVDLGAKITPTGIDANGEVSGTLRYQEQCRACGHETRAMVYSGGKWRQESPRHELTQAAAVSKGRVAGNVGSYPVIWVHHGQPLTLALPDGSLLGTATGINTAGDVSGTFDVSGNQHCFIWSFATQTSRDLGFLAGGDHCQAGGIDNRGRVYGSSGITPGVLGHAFVWRDGHMHKLPSLKGHGPAMALAGNAAGQVVGWAQANEHREYFRHAVLWQNGVIQDLAPGCCRESAANAVNEAGTIVGGGRDPGGDNPNLLAMRFEAGQIIYLQNEVVNKAGWDTLTDATGISRTGVIVGYGWRTDGKEHGFMLIPQ